MILGNPVRSRIYPTKSGTRLYLSQPYGCTGFSWEPALGDCKHFHRGIDIAASNGSGGVDILAVLSGTVRVSQREPNGEQIIAIDHGGGIVSFYGHLRSRLVQKGQRVARGQHIGEMGTTGNSTGNHLHLALKRGVDTRPGVNVYPDSNGRYFDPWPLLEQNVRVRPKQRTEGIRLRSSLSLSPSAIYAETVLGDRIERVSDGADLGSSVTWRSWGGTIVGPKYVAGGSISTRWEVIFIGARKLYIATLLAQRSVS